MDPPVERADGDTDKDTGEKKNKKILQQCCGSGTLMQIVIFLPIGSKKHRILDPGSSTLLVTILRKKVEEKKFKKYCSVAVIFYPSRIPGSKKHQILDPRSSTLLVTILWKKIEKNKKNIAVLQIRTTDPDFLPIADPGVKKAPEPGSWILDPDPQHC
jgi:hypothetical protein